MSLSGIVKFFLGFLLALTILAGGSIAAALYFVTKLTALPPRPSFSNEANTTQLASSKTKPQKTSTGSLASSEEAESAKSTSAPKPLEPGAYRARVNWPDGLILRDRPSFDANSVGGVEFNGRVVVLETTADKGWEKIRLENGDQQGWIKGGNTDRVNDN